LIGIAGPSASGKTALASLLVDSLPARSPLRVPLDHYYKDLQDLEPALQDGHNFDHPDALDHPLLIRQLRELAGGRPVDMPLYRFETHTRVREVRRMTPGGVIVVDGLYSLYWEPIRKLLDSRLFVDADHETCLARRIARDTRERGRSEASVREQYARTVRPMCERYIRPTLRFADLVLRGEAPLDRNLAKVLEHVGIDSCRKK
jgi:uridine kinase